MAVYTNIPDAYSYLKRCLEQTFEGLKQAEANVNRKKKDVQACYPLESTVSSTYRFKYRETVLNLVILMNYKNLLPPDVLSEGKFAQYGANINLSPPNEAIQTAIQEIFKKWRESLRCHTRQFDHLKINEQEIQFAS